MDKIIFNDLRREAKKVNLNIDIEADFDKFVDIEKARGPKFAEMGLHPTELWKIIEYNCERVEKLLNLDTFAKIHFKKTIQSGDSSIDDHELHPSSNHLQYMKAAEIGKTGGFDLFDKKSFDDFVVWIYQKAFAGKKLADIKSASLLNLEKFGLLVHQSSFMDRELPTDNLVEKPIEKKVPEFDESKLGGENFTNYVPHTYGGEPIEKKVPESEKPISEPENNQSTAVQDENNQSTAVQDENNQSTAVQDENNQSTAVQDENNQSTAVQDENNQSTAVQDENNQSTTTEINKPDESDDFEVVNPKIEELD